MSEEQRYLLYTKTGLVFGWQEVLAKKEGMVEIPAAEALAILATGRPRPMDTPVSITEPVAAMSPMAINTTVAIDTSAEVNRDLADQPERGPVKVKKVAQKGPFDK